MKCPECGAAVAPHHMTCGECRATLRTEPYVLDRTPKPCTRCGAPTSPQMTALRVGGYGVGPSIGKAVFGDTLESVIQVRIDTCGACGHMDFYRA